MNKTVMLDFIKVIYRMAEKNDFSNCSHFHVTVDEFIRILGEDIKDYNALIDAMRQYQKESTLNNLREVRGIIKDMYENMPKCDYAFDEIGSYVIYDKAGIRINPEKIVKILNDNNRLFPFYAMNFPMAFSAHRHQISLQFIVNSCIGFMMHLSSTSSFTSLAFEIIRPQSSKSFLSPFITS